MSSDIFRLDPRFHTTCSTCTVDRKASGKPTHIILCGSVLFWFRRRKIIVPVADLPAREPYCDRLGLVCILQICNKT